MKIREIVRENGKLKAKVSDDNYGVSLLTTRNGHHWTGQTMSPELARLTIEVLQEYLDKGFEDK